MIDPAAAVTVTGPSTNTVVHNLTLGGGGADRATLRLDGATAGDIEVTNITTMNADAELVLANGRSISSAMTIFNSGIIRGSGIFDAALVNLTTGELRVAAGESLFINGASHSNSGKVEAIGGSMEFVGALTNNANVGLITGGNATYRFRNGLTNNGSLMLSFGTNNVSGDITNSATGKIVVAGGAAATFYDDVTQNGTLQVIKVGSTNSVAVFAGAFTGSGGSSGGGDIFFLGDLRPGNSPASVTFGNNVAFASSATLSIEIGGTAQGTGFDHVNVTGGLTLDGALQLSIIGGFTPVAGNSFDVLDWGSVSGTFNALQLQSLGANLMWNSAQLYTSGVLRVAVAGDYNFNGVVDTADYVVWRKTLGQIGGPLAADGNNNGQIDSGDLTVWRSHFGQTAGAGAGSETAQSAAIPEPAALEMLLIAAAACCRPRRSQAA